MGNEGVLELLDETGKVAHQFPYKLNCWEHRDYSQLFSAKKAVDMLVEQHSVEARAATAKLVRVSQRDVATSYGLSMFSLTKYT
jgi:hypothetical protein